MKITSTSEAARTLSLSRRKVEGTCPVCGTTFNGMRYRRYCSDACSSKAYRERHPEQWRKTNRENQRRRYQRLKERRDTAL